MFINKFDVFRTQKAFYNYYYIKKRYRGIKPFDPLRIAYAKGIISPQHFDKEDN